MSPERPGASIDSLYELCGELRDRMETIEEKIDQIHDTLRTPHYPDHSFESHLNDD